VDDVNQRDEMTYRPEGRLSSRFYERDQVKKAERLSLCKTGLGKKRVKKLENFREKNRSHKN
jgi:hypothetical protein